MGLLLWLAAVLARLGALVGASFPFGSVPAAIAASLNLGALGSCAIVLGLLALSDAKWGRVSGMGASVAGPLPLATALTGLLLAFWGVAGALIACCRDKALLRPFVILSLPVYLISLGAFALLEAIRPSPAPGAAAAQAARMFAAVLLGPHFLVRAAEDPRKTLRAAGTCPFLAYYVPKRKRPRSAPAGDHKC